MPEMFQPSVPERSLLSTTYIYWGCTLSTQFIMQLKLVYRFLRKISDWTVDGFYSEVHLEGQENVPEEEPLIMYVHSSTLSWASFTWLLS